MCLWYREGSEFWHWSRAHPLKISHKRKKVQNNAAIFYTLTIAPFPNSLLYSIISIPLVVISPRVPMFQSLSLIIFFQSFSNFHGQTKKFYYFSVTVINIGLIIASISKDNIQSDEQWLLLESINNYMIKSISNSKAKGSLGRRDNSDYLEKIRFMDIDVISFFSE